MKRDFYYSEKAFNTFAEYDDWVNLALINGEWTPFTEQIEVGKPPLSTTWGDLIYLGRGNKTKVVDYELWEVIK